MKDLSLIIPCFNEQDNISKLFEVIEILLKSSNYLEVIIVNNGSTDQTDEKIKNHHIYKNNLIKLVNIQKNIGYGHGIMSGVYKAESKFISWSHADLQTDPQDVLNAFQKNIQKLNNENVVIKGKRTNRNLFDELFTLGMSIFASFLFKYKLSDINAQPKIFPRKFLILLNNPPLDFSLDLYFLIVAKINKYEIIDYPVILKKRIAGEAKGGGSLLGKIRLIIRTIRYIFNLKKTIKNKYGENYS